MIEFLAAGSLSLKTVNVFNDPTRLFEAADSIQKLYIIAQDLPDEKFATLKKNIETVYDQVEKNLIERFAAEYQAGNIEEMHRIATVMAQFKGYTQCIDVFIELSQDVPHGTDIYDGILPLCQYNYDIITRVFSNPNKVMSKFILNIYQLKLCQYAQMRLDDRRDEKKFLKTLYDLYVRTLKLSSDLTMIKMNLEDDLLTKLTEHIFQKYIKVRPFSSKIKFRSFQILKKWA